MLLQRRLSVVLVLPLAAFVSCSRPKTFDTSLQVRPEQKAEVRMSVNVLAAADEASRQMRQLQLMFIVSEVSRLEKNPAPRAGTFGAVTTTSARPTDDVQVTATPETSSQAIDWPCIALHETGNDTTMHGSSYSSRYGVMNQAVRENASPESAARILSGTASVEEQTVMAQRIVDRFGIRAWAARTVELCS